MTLHHPQTLQCESAKDKNVGLDTHHTTCQSCKLMLIQHYYSINKLYANLTTSSNNVSFSSLSRSCPKACVCCIHLLCLSGSFSLQFLTSSMSLLFLQFEKICPSTCVHSRFSCDLTQVMHYIRVCQTSPPQVIVFFPITIEPAQCEKLFKDTCKYSDPHQTSGFIILMTRT